VSKTVEAYRKAAMDLYGANRAEAENYIRSPEEDPGQWAPNSLAVIYLEPDFRFPEDTGVIPDRLGYWSPRGMDECFKLGEKAGTGYIEYINAAVAAVYEC
jgi:hypothetical protein